MQREGGTGKHSSHCLRTNKIRSTVFAPSESCIYRAAKSVRNAENVQFFLPLFNLQR